MPLSFASNAGEFGLFEGAAGELMDIQARPLRWRDALPACARARAILANSSEGVADP
jgi:hypothetical protein